MIPAIPLSALALSAPVLLNIAGQAVERSRQIDLERVAHVVMWDRGLPIGPPAANVSDALEKLIVKEQNYTCHYGNGDLHPLALGRRIDHKFPMSKGGSDHRVNLVASCPKHDREKGAGNYTRFMLRVRLDPELRECGR